jgi:cinnamyl-alcohol dehydrogenase
MEETQEMLNFAAQKDVRCMIEVVPVQGINKAMDRLEKNDVRYRFVVDIANNIAENHEPKHCY